MIEDHLPVVDEEILELESRCLGILRSPGRHMRKWVHRDKQHGGRLSDARGQGSSLGPILGGRKRMTTILYVPGSQSFRVTAVDVQINAIERVRFRSYLLLSDRRHRSRFH